MIGSDTSLRSFSYIGIEKYVGKERRMGGKLILEYYYHFGSSTSR